MRTLTGFFLLVGMILFISSCTSLQWQKSENIYGSPLQLEKRHHEFFWGFWDASGPHSSAEFCGSDEIETLTVRRSPSDIVYAIITLGIYTPESVSAVCRKEISRR